ncbi:signal transduction histidine kinase [Rhodococcus sp. PvR044]|uniref:sensor histidine kinase n=1 Tax=unclassified Rhodococcus (in: high G+C Gram-positive bacteria) TaxID=192944 RepID=UPI000BCE069D|nr:MULTISPECIES: ATP-binding protein [unclassified Rhodococcus (in: high G+C Gram-positive bacteria)]MBP1161753.1 signal transduction histidine kinase [Rhodococcus sp. PvR099]PTR38120.1 signal transduction histidine kinase [Rhodococcus sp. OK611]SNX93052.1 Signal transduction histidine kinase [Rhodococcus sp. OK270]
MAATTAAAPRPPVTTPANSRRHESSDHISRMVARLISAGYAAYLILLLPAAISMAPRMDAWWTPVVVAGVYGSGLLPGALSFRRDTRPMRIASGVAATAFLLAVFSWPLAWNGPPLPSGELLWLATFPGLASLAVVSTWPTWVMFAHLVIGCVAVQIVNFAAHEDAPRELLLPEITFAIMFCTLFIGAAVMALRTGRVLDATTDATHAAASAAAARRARTVERERFDALIHDGVMSTLLAASRLGATPAVSRLATTTLRQLDALRDGRGAQEHFGCEEALSLLRAAATDVDEGVALRVERLDGAETLTVLAETTRALAAALAEALRNSDRHAGEAATRSVEVTVAREGITVLVADDGRGFDPAAVPAHRLGVSVSIHGRMRQLHGGSARIETAPGAGTRVHLAWSSS